MINVRLNLKFDPQEAGEALDIDPDDIAKLLPWLVESFDDVPGVGDVTWELAPEPDLNDPNEEEWIAVQEVEEPDGRYGRALSQVYGTFATKDEATTWALEEEHTAHPRFPLYVAQITRITKP